MQQKAVAWAIRIRRAKWHFIEFALWIVPLYEAMGLAILRKMVSVSVLWCSSASKGYPFKNIFDFTTAGDWDRVAAVKRLPVLHYSVGFILLSFGIMCFIVEL